MASPRIGATRSALVLALASASCWQLPRDPEEPEPPEAPAFATLGSARHDTPVDTSADADAARRTQPPQIVALEAWTDALREGGTRDRHQVAVALRALADALVLLEPHRQDLVRAVRSNADVLETSPARSPEHAGLVRIALDAARTIFANGRPHDRWRMGPYARAVTAFTDAVTEVDPERPLLEQQAQVVAALDEAVSVLELAAGTDAPRG